MIQPNASSEELNSPFFLENKKACEEWERFALDQNGEIQGSYNSWSFKIFIKLDNPSPWRITVSRSTHYSGNLLLSEKHQGRYDQILIKTRVDSEEEFIIKKSSFIDFFSRKKISRLKVNKSYRVLGQTNGQVLNEITNLLSIQFKNNEILKVEVKEKFLTITIKNANEEFELIKSLVLSSHY